MTQVGQTFNSIAGLNGLFQTIDWHCRSAPYQGKLQRTMGSGGDFHGCGRQRSHSKKALQFNVSSEDNVRTEHAIHRTWTRSFLLQRSPDTGRIRRRSGDKRMESRLARP